MRRARGRAKGGRQKEERKSVRPIVVVCCSDDFKATGAFLSKTGQWQVVLHNPDTGKWWDRLAHGPRARHGPPDGLCHLVAMYRAEFQDQVQNTVKEIGESVDVATLVLLNATDRVRGEFEMVMLPGTISAISDLAYQSIRELWAVQDANDKPTPALKLSQIHDICSWPPLKWRWNRERLSDLYLRLRFPESTNPEGDRAGFKHRRVEDNNETTSEEGKAELNEDALQRLHSLRRTFEFKAASFLADTDTERMANSILSAATDRCLFGQIHARFSCARVSQFLVAPAGAALDAHRYATSNDCTGSLGQLRVVPSPSQDAFCIPVGNPMITACLLPSLFRTLSIERKGCAATSSRFDSVLGSRRIWEEHAALRACILYVFEGSPGPLWQISIQAVQSALPRTWELLFHEPPDEEFLRALLHPDIVDAGRLRRDFRGSDNGGGDAEPRQIPSHFEAMSRIYSLGRFIRTLRDSSALDVLEGEAVRRAVSDTMKVTRDQLDAVINDMSATGGTVSPKACTEIARISSTACPAAAEREGAEMTPKAREALAMLGLFLFRDRRSVHDASRGEAERDETSSFPHGTTTTRAMADCAMFCGAIRWLSADDDDEGIWTCSPCMHRWQKRGSNEAYQTRKMLHPMKMVPFRREEYYNAADWDAVMEATGSDVSKLGIDHYWGKCTTDGCGRVCRAVPRSGACAETDGVPLQDFPEIVSVDDGSEVLGLRQSLGKGLDPSTSPNTTVPSADLEAYFDSEEKLMHLPGGLRRRVRNCIDKSRYILPENVLCDQCDLPEDTIDEYCPHCGTGFEPVFACVHYSCPHCAKHFCKACLGIDGVHFSGVYSNEHVCWKILGNRYAYQNRGFCAQCGKERPWPKSHALESAGPEIRRLAQDMEGGMPMDVAVGMQSSNLRAFTERYAEAVTIFENCSHTEGQGSEYCHCGAGVNADEHDHGY